MSFVKRETKFLVAIVVIGALLRFFAIGQRDFWFDEAFSYHIARLPLQDLIAASLTDNNPPLYYLLLHYILKISDNEIVLRLPSLFLNLLSIPLIYALFKTLINKRVAIIATSLFSLSPLAIYTATEARPHGPALIFVVLITTAFFKLTKQPHIQNAIVFIFFSILGLFTHFYIFLLFFPFTWIIRFSKTGVSIAKWLMILAIIFSAFAPWLFFSFQNIHSACACPTTLLSLPASLVSPTIGGVGNVTMRSFPSLPLPYLILFSGTSFFTLFLFLQGLRKNLLVTPIYIIPLIALSLSGLFLPVFSPKAFSLFSPFYFGIVAYGIYLLKTPIIAVLLFIMLGTISLIQISNPFFAGERIKPVNQIVNQNRTYPVAHTSLFTYYSLSYYSQSKQSQMLLTKNPLSPATLSFIGGYQQEVDKNIERLWLVDTEKWAEIKGREIAFKKIFNTYFVEKTYKVDRISVRLLKRK